MGEAYATRHPRLLQSHWWASMKVKRSVLPVAQPSLASEDGVRPPLDGPHRKEGAMEEITDDRWITRQELADRYGVPVKTPAEWASKRIGLPYAKFGRHVRYRLRDVVAWEAKQLDEHNRDCA
jgi:hypothetical protein